VRFDGKLLNSIRVIQVRRVSVAGWMVFPFIKPNDIRKPLQLRLPIDYQELSKT